jgi:hypothetical protein
LKSARSDLDFEWVRGTDRLYFSNGLDLIKGSMSGTPRQTMRKRRASLHYHVVWYRKDG